MNKNIIASLLVLGFSSVAQAQNATVPSEFHGFWDKKETCPLSLELIGVPEAGAEISSTEFMAYEEPCKVQQVTTIGQQSLQLDLQCASPDGSYEKTVEIELINDQQLIITHGEHSSEPLVRCK